jgi:hypothetical protein
MKFWLLVAIVVGILYLGGGDPVQGAFVAISMIERGRRLTSSTFDKATGNIVEDPQYLADQCPDAEGDLDLYALARLISSEEGGPLNGNTERVAVAWGMINYAAASGMSISAILLQNSSSVKAGHFGTQPGRFASTRQDPYQGDLDIARSCMQGTIADITNGATHWDVPSGEDAAAVTANRTASGLVPYAVDGIDSVSLRFWGPRTS